MFDYVNKMARYNANTNKQLFMQLDTLSKLELNKIEVTRFSSIMGILNHMIFGYCRITKILNEVIELDSEYLRLLSLKHEYDEIITKDYEEVKLLIAKFDDLYLELTNTLRSSDYEINVNDHHAYDYFMHLFIHNTHHRGEIKSILDQYYKFDDFSSYIINTK